MGLKEPGLRGSLRSVSTGVSAIPDSVLAQFDATQDDQSLGSITSIPDQIGNNDLAGDAELVEDGIDNGPSYRFTTSDFMSVNGVNATTEDIGVIIVCQLATAASNNFFFGARDGDRPNLTFDLQDDDAGNYDVFRRDNGSGASFSAGTPDTNDHILELRGFNTDEAELVEDGTALGGGSDGNGTIEDFALGGRFRFEGIDMDVAECVILEDASVSDFETERERLSNKYNISISS